MNIMETRLLGNYVDIQMYNEDFGVVWKINAIDKSFRFALYMYDDDENTMYLSNIFVKRSERNQGLGDSILMSADELARRVNAKQIILTVKDDSFMHNWYKRRGYEDLEDNYERRGYVWMIKHLNK